MPSAGEIVSCTSPPNAAAGLAQLVLTLIELIRELMERQAVARYRLVLEFGLTREHLNIDLGQLGRLM